MRIRLSSILSMACRCLVLISILTPVFSAVAEDNQNSALFEAVQMANVTKMKELLASGADANYNESGRSLLGWAAQNGDLQVIETLLEAKADVNYVEESLKHSPLLRAIETGHAPVVDRLIKAGANVNQKELEGNTAVIMAIKNRKPTILQALIKAGADVKATGADGDTPAMVAVRDGMPESIECIKILGAAGADLNAPDMIYTPLYYAVDQENKGSVKALLDAGADPNAKTPGGKSPIFEAVSSTEILNLLLERKANPNAISEQGQPLLISAVESGTPECVQILLKAGVDIDQRDSSGNSALMMARNYSKTDVEHLLKKSGATQ